MKTLNIERHIQYLLNKFNEQEFVISQRNIGKVITELNENSFISVMNKSYYTIPEVIVALNVIAQRDKSIAKKLLSINDNKVLDYEIVFCEIFGRFVTHFYEGYVSGSSENLIVNYYFSAFYNQIIQSSYLLEGINKVKDYLVGKYVAAAALDGPSDNEIDCVSDMRIYLITDVKYTTHHDEVNIITLVTPSSEIYLPYVYGILSKKESEFLKQSNINMLSLNKYISINFDTEELI